jgi:hypothetical protein
MRLDATGRGEDGRVGEIVVLFGVARLSTLLSYGALLGTELYQVRLLFSKRPTKLATDHIQSGQGCESDLRSEVDGEKALLEDDELLHW